MNTKEDKNMSNSINTNKFINSIIKTLQRNKKRIDSIEIKYRDKDKQDPRTSFLNIYSSLKDITMAIEQIEYLKFEIYLKYPLK